MRSGRVSDIVGGDFLTPYNTKRYHLVHSRTRSCPCSLRLIQQPGKPGTIPSFQHVYEGVLPWYRLCSSTSSR